MTAARRRWWSISLIQRWLSIKGNMRVRRGSAQGAGKIERAGKDPQRLDSREGSTILSHGPLLPRPALPGREVCMGGESFSHCDISIPSPLARFYRPQLGFLQSSVRLWVSPGASRKGYQLCPPLPMCLPFSPAAWFSLAFITLWIQYICL